MKNLLLATLLVLPQAHAQNVAPAAPAAAPDATPADAPIDMAARRQSVVDLKAHIAARETRLQEIAADIRSLDDRNEKRIDSIVNTLKGLKDSQESKTRVNRLKADVIAGLRKSITIYQEKRRAIFERLRTDKSEVLADSLTKDIERFDARTKKRLDQIMELAKSMPESKDVEKYVSDGGDWWNGYYYENTRISEKWKQNRRQGVATEVNLRDLRNALGKAIENQESRRDSIANLLENRNLSEAERSVQERELGRTDALIENLRRDRAELSVPGTVAQDDNSEDRYSSDPGAKEQATSADDANAMKALLEDSSRDISADFWNILSKYSEATRERDKIVALKANLAAREEWLEEHDDAAE